MAEHIVAVFDAEAAAAAAARELLSAGIPQAAIRQYRRGDAASTGAVGSAASTGAASTGAASTGTGADRPSGRGFWAWLLGEEGPQPRAETTDADDITFYERRVEAGGTILAVTVDDDSKIHAAVDIIEAHDPLRIEERADEEATEPGTVSPGVATSGVDTSTGATLRTNDVASTSTAPAGQLSGAASGLAATAPVGLPNTAATGAAATGRDWSTQERAGVSPDLRATPGTSAGATTGSAATREETIPLAEEQLNVGKRSVERGTTRVRRYVVETPVERNVTLHGERVTVERRRPVQSASPDGTAFEERTVEVRETEEVPVVEKTARVVEEVVVRREATERVETVRDSVRRDEVEIEPGTGTAAPEHATQAESTRQR